MKRITQRLELYNGSVCCGSYFSNENPTLQNLDTSLISLLKGVDECGKVNNFGYSEDEIVNLYDDVMERSTETEHELAYYQGLSANVVENQQNSQNVDNTSTVTNESSESSPSET